MFMQWEGEIAFGHFRGLKGYQLQPKTGKVV